MSDETVVAPSEAAEIVVADDQVTQEQQAPEAAENTQGQPKEVPAEDEAKKAAEAEEERSNRNQRRKAQRERLIADKEAAERAAREAEQDAKRTRDALAAMKPPKMADYDGDFDQWNAANTAYLIARGMDERQAQSQEAAAKAHLERQNAAEERMISEAVTAIRTEGVEKYPDFRDVVMRPAEDGGPVITKDMLRILGDSDVGADVAYMLGKDPDLSRAIAQMNPVQQARAIGRLEAQAQAPKPKTVTTAPDPITPGAGKSAPQKRWEEMTPSEYDAWRAAGGTF